MLLRDRVNYQLCSKQKYTYNWNLSKESEIHKFFDMQIMLLDRIVFLTKKEGVEVKVFLGKKIYLNFCFRNNYTSLLNSKSVFYLSPAVSLRYHHAVLKCLQGGANPDRWLAKCQKVVERGCMYSLNNIYERKKKLVVAKFFKYSISKSKVAPRSY